MTLLDFVTTFLRKMLNCHNLEAVHQQIQHLAFIVNLGENLCSEDLELILNEHENVNKEVEGGLLTWDNAAYFRNWEQSVLMMVKKEESDHDMENYDLYEEKEKKPRKKRKLKREKQQEYEIYDDDDLPDDFDPSDLVRTQYNDEGDDQSPRKVAEGKRCDLCPFFGKRDRPLQKHKFDEHNLTSCSVCGETFEEFDPFYAHILTHYEPINCPYCPAQCLTERRLNNHIEAEHMGRAKPKYKGKKEDAKYCQSCEFITTSQKRLERHNFDVHQLRSCGVCGQSFEKYEQLHKHNLVHQGIIDESSANLKGEKKICPHCGESFVKLEAHIKFVHNREANLKKCPHPGCDYIGQRLTVHMKNMHTDQNIVNCPWCGTITKRLHRHLKEHQCNIPEHERKVKQKAVCEYCKKEYSSVKIMREHMKNMHSDVKEYPCEICGFKTKHKNNLVMHIRRVHEGRPLKETCSICNKTCSNLQWHISTYHPVS